MKTRDFFKPEDFQSQTAWSCHSKSLAYIANAKLNALIESMAVVYSIEGTISETWSNTKNKFNTHKGRLAFIEEIVKEPCKHEPISRWTVSGELQSVVTCKHCGVELVAEWKTK